MKQQAALSIILFLTLFYAPFSFTYRNLTTQNSIQKKQPPNSFLKKRKLLITGCARSGTAYITKFLKINNLNVKHEIDGKYGIVSWLMAADSYKAPFGPGANNFLFEHIFHQVRHPLKTIASASNEPSNSWRYIKKYIPQINKTDPKIVKAAKYWYYWNLLAEIKAEWTYRIEDIENQVDEMSLRLNVPLDSSLLEKIPKNANTRNYKDAYTWSDLKKAIDEELFYNIIEMATRYGYEVEENY
jgi:hypothetical protein